MELDNEVVERQGRRATRWRQLLQAFGALEGHPQARGDYSHMNITLQRSEDGGEYLVTFGHTSVVFALVYAENGNGKVVGTTSNPFKKGERLHVLTFSLDFQGMTDFTEHGRPLNLHSAAFHIQALAIELAVKTQLRAAEEISAA